MKKSLKRKRKKDFCTRNKNGGTPERRKQQSERIKHWKPWKSSTGATTEQGKETCKMNAFKHGFYGAEIKAIQKIIAEIEKG